ncbi:MAG: hypothetical protein LBS01_05735 [Prevotellaceae bacterium]|jgi:hypothetical protein|nr:hypothetical protein [Prevotellaceae bacterium]
MSEYIYNKPYILRSVPNERDDFIFINPYTHSVSMLDNGWTLPCKFPEGDNRNNLKPDTDPKDYDLTFTSPIPLERLLTYDFAPDTHLIVNNKVLKVLYEICPDDFQVFPVKIISDPEKKLQPYECNDYVLINITRVIDCIDYKKSICEYKKNLKGLFHCMSAIDHVDKVFLKPTDEKFFIGCVEEGYTTSKIISQEFLDIIIKEKWKGPHVYCDYAWANINDLTPVYPAPKQKNR